MEENKLLTDKEKKTKARDKIWIEDISLDGVDYDDMGDRIVTALEQFCGIKDAKFIYIRKAGNHLEVGKAEVKYKFKENDVVDAKAVCIV